MRLQDVVVVVKEVHRHLEPLNFPVPIHAIRTYITKNLQIAFDVFDKGTWSGKLILGRLLRYERNGTKSASIIVSDTLNTCWTRFVACKEMAHLLLDKEEDCTSDPIALIQELVELPLAIDEDIHSERLAMFAAIELLVPWQRREDILAMSGGGKSNYEIANELKVPEKVIDFWQSSHYQKLLQEAWRGI